MGSRPFLQWSTSGLEVLFRQSQDDPAKLAEIVSELECRKGRSATVLKAKITRHLKQLQNSRYPRSVPSQSDPEKASALSDTIANETVGSAADSESIVVTDDSEYPNDLVPTINNLRYIVYSCHGKSSNPNRTDG